MKGAKNIKCPSCARQLESSALVCAQCGGPTGAELDCFTALGLPFALVIDESVLEQSYLDLSRRVHPDRFVQSSPSIRDASLRTTALLTRSYRTLRDPVSRGIYWLSRHGAKLEENNRVVPGELAELVFDVQEQLAGLRSVQRGAAAWREQAQSVAQRRGEIAALEGEARTALERIFVRADTCAGDAEDKSALVADLKAVLARIAYLRTLGRDVDKELESVEAA
jgi:hypothetical protein